MIIVTNISIMHENIWISAVGRAGLPTVSAATLINCQRARQGRTSVMGQAGKFRPVQVIDC